MNQNENLIEHEGIIQKIENNTIFVKITSQSACSECQARGACENNDEFREKIIKVDLHSTSTKQYYRSGNKVTVFISKSTGFKALFWGYLLPFIIMTMLLFITMLIFKNESLAGIIALGVLIPYYFGLYFFRDNLKKQFHFGIK